MEDQEQKNGALNGSRNENAAATHSVRETEKQYLETAGVGVVETIKEALRGFAKLESFLPEGIKQFIAENEFFSPLCDDKKKCNGVIFAYCYYVGTPGRHYGMKQKCPVENCRGILHELVQAGHIFMQGVPYFRRPIHDHFLKCEKCDFKTLMAMDSCECSAARAR